MNNTHDSMIVLAGDIGGTKTNLGLFQMGKVRPVMKCMETFPSHEAKGLEELIKRFLNKHPASITAACFGLAGPVVNGQCNTTNLPWRVTKTRIKTRFKWTHVRLINDLAATAMAVPLLNSRELFALNKAKPKKQQTLGLVSPGTGLGQTLLVFQNNHSIPVPSEGGHADFAPNNKQEMKLWEFLHERYGHVSVERVLSGPGLLNIYTWVKASGKYGEPAWLTRKIQETDPAKAVSEAAIHDKDPACVASLNTFAAIFGAIAGNLALTGMTMGGMFLGGGIAPKILPILEKGGFMRSFVNKGRFKGLLEKIPVRVILNDNAALLGAAYSGLTLGPLP